MTPATASLRERLGAGSGLREGSAQIARRIAAYAERREVDDDAGRVFFEARERLATGFGVRATGLGWDDVPVNERLLTTAALREVVAAGVLPVAVS